MAGVYQKRILRSESELVRSGSFFWGADGCHCLTHEMGYCTRNAQATDTNLKCNESGRTILPVNGRNEATTIKLRHRPGARGVIPSSPPPTPGALNFQILPSDFSN